MEDQKKIADSVRETFESHSRGKGINSIVKLLALERPAAIPEMGSTETSENFQQLILAELSQLRDEVRSVRRDSRLKTMRIHQGDTQTEVENIYEMLGKCKHYLILDDEEVNKEAQMIFGRCCRKFMELKSNFVNMSNIDKEIMMKLEDDIRVIQNKINDLKQGVFSPN